MSAGRVEVGVTWQSCPGAQKQDEPGGGGQDAAGADCKAGGCPEGIVHLARPVMMMALIALPLHMNHTVSRSLSPLSFLAPPWQSALRLNCKEKQQQQQQDQAAFCVHLHSTSGRGPR